MCYHTRKQKKTIKPSGSRPWWPGARIKAPKSALEPLKPRLPRKLVTSPRPTALPEMETTRRLPGPSQHSPQASRGFEPQSLDSGSRVLTVTPRGQMQSVSPSTGAWMARKDGGCESKSGVSDVGPTLRWHENRPRQHPTHRLRLRVFCCLCALCCLCIVLSVRCVFCALRCLCIVLSVCCLCCLLVVCVLCLLPCLVCVLCRLICVFCCLCVVLSVHCVVCASRCLRIALSVRCVVCVSCCLCVVMSVGLCVVLSVCCVVCVLCCLCVVCVLCRVVALFCFVFFV